MIDGYSHCGISKYRPVEDVIHVMRVAGVERAVLCQHLGEYDNSYLDEVVAKHPAKFAAICLVDPAAPNASSLLRQWHQSGHFRGVRLLADWLRDYSDLWVEAIELGLTLVLYSPDGMASSAAQVADFLGRCPRARIVMTHLGNPQLRDRHADASILELVRFPDLYVQLSGLSMFCQYPHRELDELIRVVIREFGASRIYWGSNYPVCGGEMEYLRDWAHVTNGAWGLSVEQIAWITQQTAERLWFSS